MTIIHFDGACEPRNPGGHIGYGIVVYKNNIILYENSWYGRPSKNNSNNVAEHLALHQALLYVKDNGLKEVTIRGDSEMAIRQMEGIYRIKNGLYKEYAIKNKILFNELSKHSIIEFEWVPRHENESADRLSKTQLEERGIFSRR